MMSFKTLRQESALTGVTAFKLATFKLPLGDDKVSMLSHTYPHKPLRKTKVTICNHQADSPLYVWADA